MDKINVLNLLAVVLTSGFFWTILGQMEGSGFARNLSFLEIIP